MLDAELIVYTIFLIFTGAAVVATLVLFTRQSLLVAYILLGVALGPWGFKLVSDASVVKQIGEIGIIFLLFLLGLHLQPQNLLHMLRKATWVALITSLLFAGVSYAICNYFGFNHADSLVVGIAMMFSSTIIGLKLLPTTIMHHRHTGEVMISVLLMQDIIAILVLILLHSGQNGGITMHDFAGLALGLPAMILLAFLVERFILVKLIKRFDQTQEYIFLLAIGWCLGLARLSHVFGLSEEIGAFVGGETLASSPIALYIAESLKPLRDFFLVMFFFSIGASFDFAHLDVILWPAIILSLVMLTLKPISYEFLLRWTGESKQISREVGFRLGQGSEFSLLVVSLALAGGLISQRALYLVEATTIVTFIVSSYFVVLKYPTPIALSDKMRQD